MAKPTVGYKWRACSIMVDEGRTFHSYIDGLCTGCAPGWEVYKVCGACFSRRFTPTGICKNCRMRNTETPEPDMEVLIAERREESERHYKQLIGEN